VNRLKRFFFANIREISSILVIILLSIFVEYRSGGNFLTVENISDLLTETAILSILAVGMMMVIITGGIDLSIGSVMALAGMIGTTVLKNNRHLSPLTIIVLAIGIGILSGFINGTLVAKLRILPIIATLGMMNVFRGITYIISNGKWVMQADMTPEFMQVASGKIFGINNLVVMAIVVYAVGYIFLNFIRTGRKIYAVGNSEESARVSGINTVRTIRLAYTIMGAVAGFAGILYVAKFAVSQGETAVGYEMNVIAACVLGGVNISGGTGRVQGVLLGALLLGLLNNAMPLIKISSFWQEAIRGLIILLSIIVNSLIQRNVEAKALRRRNI
jgi:rhamnose transport system permease protein